VFLGVTLLVLDKEVELPNIPSTRSDSEVLAIVHDYLKATDAQTIEDVDVITNCWTEFGDADFNIEYFSLTGIWRINAYYNAVRYYWRVDDATMTLTRDLWFQPTFRTIKC
jgi:hypothetical protein